MSDAQQTSDASAWHRKLAAACNRAWELSVPDRGPAEDREMLNAAHASAWRWSQVGSELNRMRATMLLAEVHALLCFAQSAPAYATEMREYFLRIGAPEWETAFVHVIHAHSPAAAGAREQLISSYELATAAPAAIQDEEKRSIVAKTFGHVPAP